MRLIYHPAAEAELIEAAQFYERRINSLGAQFLEAADRVNKRILEEPERCRTIEEDVRLFQMPRFPIRSLLSRFARPDPNSRLQTPQPGSRLLAFPPFRIRVPFLR